MFESSNLAWLFVLPCVLSFYIVWIIGLLGEDEKWRRQLFF